jgi:transcriptional regulator of acetoin/glycerol metabolism
MVDLDGRILRPPECQEHYVDSEDENLGAMMLANKTENATAHTANTARRLNERPDDTRLLVQPVESFFESSSQERNIAQDEALKPAEMVVFVHTANTAERNIAQDEALKPAEMIDFERTANTAKRIVTQDKAPKPLLSCKGDFAGYDFAGYYLDASKQLVAIEYCR